MGLWVSRLYQVKGVTFFETLCVEQAVNTGLLLDTRELELGRVWNTDTDTAVF